MMCDITDECPYSDYQLLFRWRQVSVCILMFILKVYFHWHKKVREWLQYQYVGSGWYSGWVVIERPQVWNLALPILPSTDSPVLSVIHKKLCKYRFLKKFLPLQNFVSIQERNTKTITNNKDFCVSCHLWGFWVGKYWQRDKFHPCEIKESLNIPIFRGNIYAP